MNYNYHTHTYHCGHASGQPEEYVKNAIDFGIKHLGFSEHGPYPFEGEWKGMHTLRIHEIPVYFAEIEALRQKYRNDIEISIGFEIEYFPDKFPSTYEFLRKIGAEYLILGQHFKHGIYTGGHHVIKPTDSQDDFRKYVSEVTEAMETGAFTYVAHPDMFNFTGNETVYADEMRKICIASKRLNIPLEINCQGICDNRIYPAERFWAVAGVVGCPVTIGIDAHSPEAMLDSKSLSRAEEIIEKYRLNYIGKPTLRKVAG